MRLSLEKHPSGGGVYIRNSWNLVPDNGRYSHFMTSSDRHDVSSKQKYKRSLELPSPIKTLLSMTTNGNTEIERRQWRYPSARQRP